LGIVVAWRCWNILWRTLPSTSSSISACAVVLDVPQHISVFCFPRDKDVRSLVPRNKLEKGRRNVWLLQIFGFWVKSISKKITLKIINIIFACLQPFLGFSEPSSTRTDLKKATDLGVWFEFRTGVLSWKWIVFS
jgi:hypothetical protein